MNVLSNDKYQSLRSFSTRHLYSSVLVYKVLSMDANSIDLKVLAKLAKISGWEKIFDLGLDNHFEILRIGNPSFFEKIFKKFGGLKIAGVKKISAPPEADNFLLITEVESIILSKQDYTWLKQGRDTAKETNLGIPYMLGATSLAEKISKATNKPMSIVEAEEMLEQYYENFPEIRAHHDHFVMEIFSRGYYHPQVETKNFGMKLHSNTWFSLNNHKRVKDNEYELILKYRGHHFHISLNNWLQDGSLVDGEVSVGLAAALKPFSIFFKEVNSIRQLNDSIFAIKLKTSKSKSRKNEEKTEDESDFEIGAIDRSHLIKQELKNLCQENELNELEHVLLLKITHGEIFKLEEDLIQFYCDTSSAGRHYFKTFVSLFKDAKKLFPSYIQGVSAVCVGRVFKTIREIFELRNLKSYIFLSVHDSIDIMAHISEIEEVSAIIRDKNVLETFIPVTWSYDKPSDHWC